jgi:hypothetical protein
VFLKILTLCKCRVTVGQAEDYQTKETSPFIVNHGFYHEQYLERHWDMYASGSDVEARMFLQIHPSIVCKLMLLNLSKECSRVSCFITDKPVLTEHSFYDPQRNPSSATAKVNIQQIARDIEIVDFSWIFCTK